MVGDALTNTTAALHNAAGCVYTDNNAGDISIGLPTPRNSASPANHFDHWSGGATGSSNPLTLIMDDDKSVTAHFVVNAVSGQMVISQVYGGGGNSGSTYKNDYVELFNRGNAPVNVTGWTVQYGPAAGSTWSSTTLVGTIPPGRYYLVQEGTGGGGSVSLPSPDAIGAINLAATDGKVALVSDNVLLTGTCPNTASLVDLVGYGNANCSETNPTTGLTNLLASFRNNGGCDETNNNLADFSSNAPAPRNSATPFHMCDLWVGVGDSPTVELALSAPAPNPSHGTLRIPFALPADAHVSLHVLDVQGRKVANLVDGVLSAGRHEVTWETSKSGDAVKPGLYFVRLEAAGRRLVRTVVVMR